MSEAQHKQGQIEVGQRLLDRYRVEARIGTGGHSVVFRGLDERLERSVCIKSFSKLDGKEGVRATVYEHFIQEAFALSSLSHPNTLRIYDFGYLDSAGGRLPFQVSEYMPGGTLAQWVKSRGRLRPEEALPSLCKIANALAEAHERGLIHRDIKPQNILFTTKGEDREPKLADFGIAKSIGNRAVTHQAEDTQLVAGCPLAMYSPAWAAPEQLCGSPASTAADVYSFGLVAIFSLTGTVLFPARSAQQAYDKRVAGDRLIEELLRRNEIDEDIIIALLSACAFEVRDRQRSVRSVGESLRRCLHEPQHRLSRLRIAQEQVLQQVSSTAQLVGACPGGVTSFLTTPASGSSASDNGSSDERELPLPAPPATSHRAPLPRQTSRARGSSGPARRHCHYLYVEGDGTTIELPEGRLEISATPTPHGQRSHSVTLKGLSTFVARRSGRPSSAVVVSEDMDIELVTPRREIKSQLRVLFGNPFEGSKHFQLQGNHFALSDHSYPNAIVIDDPSHRTSYVLYGFGAHRNDRN